MGSGAHTDPALQSTWATVTVDEHARANVSQLIGTTFCPGSGAQLPPTIADADADMAVEPVVSQATAGPSTIVQAPACRLTVSQPVPVQVQPFPATHTAE
jgi:hypothetical protein